MLALLRRRLGGLEGRRLASVAVRALVASGVMGAAAWLASRELVARVPGGALTAQLVQVMGAIAVALVALVAAARLLGLTEFDDAARAIWRRVRKG